MPRTKYLLALDMGSHSVKAMEVTEAAGVLQVTGFASKSFASDAERLQAASEVLQEGKFKSRYTASAISGRNVITRYIIMQNLDEEELKEAIRFEADKYIPFGIDEVVLDCQKIELLEGGDQMRVLLAAVKRNIVEDHVRILRDLGLEPTIIDVEAFAIGNAFLNSVSQETGATVSLVDIGHSKTNIVVMTEGKTMFNREVYLGAREMMEALERHMGLEAGRVEEFARDPGDSREELLEAIGGPLDDLCNEVTLSFEFYENEYDRSIDSVWLSGGGSFVSDVIGEIGTRLARPTHTWDPLAHIDLRTPPALTARMQEISGKLAVTAGLGTRVRKEI